MYSRILGTYTAVSTASVIGLCRGSVLLRMNAIGLAECFFSGGIDLTVDDPCISSTTAFQGSVNACTTQALAVVRPLLLLVLASTRSA